MVAYYAKRSQGEEFQKLLDPIKKGMWIDAANASRDETKKLAADYKLNDNILLDVHDASELPRVEYSDDNAYIFMRLPKLGKSSRVVTSPLLCVVTPHLILTIAADETLPPDSIGLNSLPITTDQPQTLALGILASCVSRYEDLIQHTAESIHATSSRLRSHEITNGDFIHFVTVEANLSDDKMNLGGTLAVAQRLRENSRQLFADKDLEALDDIILHIQQLLVSIERHTNSVESIRNAYGTVANNTLNKRMKTLTVFTVMITLPNVFFGMYGMNVVLPYMHENWVFPIIVGTSVATILILYVIARRLKIF